MKDVASSNYTNEDGVDALGVAIVNGNGRMVTPLISREQIYSE